MFALKKIFNSKFGGSSLIESVISMGIISICLFFMVMIFTVLYSKDKKNDSKLSVSIQNDIFYMTSLNQGVLVFDTIPLNINVLNINDRLIEISIKENDTTDDSFTKKIFIINEKND